MLKNAIKVGFVYRLVTTEMLHADKLSGLTETEKKTDISVIQNESGWERVKRMFEPDEFGELSNEMTTILHVGFTSLFAGAIYGGVNYSKQAYVTFLKNNQATVFTDHIEAKKKLTDACTKSFTKGAWKWGWRLSLFCSTFTGIATVVSVYRGKHTIFEYIFAGMASGALYKFKMGPKAMLVGGGLGSVLGLMGGAATIGFLYVTGLTIDDVRYWQYHWQRERKKYLKEGIDKYMAEEAGQAFAEHEKQVGKPGHTIYNLDKK